MMIQNRADLKEYLKQDMAFYHSYSAKDRFICKVTNDPIYFIAKYVYFLRKEEYYFNCKKNGFYTVLYLYNFRKKNKIGNMLGFKIPKNTFGPGLCIYHHGEIIVNENAKIGACAKLHGGNCIGNNGKSDNPPVIGDGLDLGIGAKIIGNVYLGNNISVGANAVVTKTFEDDNATLIGLPARNIGEMK